MTSADPFAGYLACTACKASAGRPCWARTGGGPQALPDVPATRPHGGRKRSGTRTTAPAAPPDAERAAARVAAATAAARRAQQQRPAPPAWLRPAPPAHE